jgi:hypothetical protein
MLIMLFLGDAVDEARRPDCGLVIVTEINHVGPGPSWSFCELPRLTAKARYSEYCITRHWNRAMCYSHSCLAFAYSDYRPIGQTAVCSVISNAS